MNRSYKMRVDHQLFDQPTLVVDVCSTIYDEDVCMYFVPLALLDQSELDLKGGRFTNFVEAPRDHMVIKQIHHSLLGVFDDWLNWVNDHVTSPWSFNIEMPSVGEGYLRWSFSDASDVLKFKLTF